MSNQVNPAAVLFRALFKAEGFARGIGLGGRGMAEHPAEVEEMILWPSVP